MKKLQLLLLVASLAAPAMAQEKFELGKPGNDAYRYLDQYKGLKEYIDHEKYPNFKLGIATENLNNSLVKNLISKNASGGRQWQHEFQQCEDVCEYCHQCRRQRLRPYPRLALAAT